MFSKAYKIASEFTFPITVSCAYLNGKAETFIGAFVVINADGWIVTAGHMFNLMFKMQKDAVLISEYDSKVEAIMNDPKIPLKNKKDKIGKIKNDPLWIKSYIMVFDEAGSEIEDVLYNKNQDFAFVKLKNIEKLGCKTYPIFKNPANLLPGTSLCKMGYPFHKIDTTFDKATGGFDIVLNDLTRHPTEGIFTKITRQKDAETGEISKFIETSTPGLKGQSGGPIFDVNGVVWAIQSQTLSYSLGFVPKVTIGKRETEEHQFLNVGIGVHIERLIEGFKEFDISYQLSE